MMADQAQSKGYVGRIIGEPVYDLPQHIKFLSMPIQGPNGDINGFDIEFKAREAKFLQISFPMAVVLFFLYQR